jgi:hypothetical protein
VVTLEIVPELAAWPPTTCAARRLNVQVRGQRRRRRARPAGEAPFDAIVLSGSVAEVPRGLLEQLKVGGRLVAIVGDRAGDARHALHPQRRGAGRSVDLFDTVAPRLQGFEKPALPLLMKQLAHRTEARLARQPAGRCCWTCASRGKPRWRACAPGPDHADLPMMQIPLRLADIDRIAPVVCICHHGVRSAQVVAFLVQRRASIGLQPRPAASTPWSTEVDPAVPRY